MIIGRPDTTEASPYYFGYIDQVGDGDLVEIVERQLVEALDLFSAVSEELSLCRYAPDTWSMRQVLNHLSDAERVFVFRMLWFARGFDTPLPSFDQSVSSDAAAADRIAWAAHVEEFRHVRLATLALLHNMPPEAWSRRGVASGKPFSVRALAYLVPGHVSHHLAILRQRYLRGPEAAGVHQ